MSEKPGAVHGRIDGVGHRITGHHAGMHRARGAGLEHLHVLIDDASRLAYRTPARRAQETATGFLIRALAWFERHCVTAVRVMTDNGSAYPSGLFRETCVRAGLRHLRTRPYTPRTNGKAERFIQTSLREWASMPDPIEPAHTAAEPCSPGSMPTAPRDHMAASQAKPPGSD